jgi:predicted RND superfamily exporter protein
MLGGAVCVPLLMVKSDPRAFIPDDATFSSALKLFEDEFYVFSPLRVLVDVGGDDRLLGLREAGAVREALSGHDGIRRVSTTAYVLSALLADGAALGSVRLALDRHAAKKGVDLVYSNAALVYGDIDRQATESLLRSLGWSVALIFGAIVILFRSLRALLASLLANAVPLMLVCGVVWLIGNPLNLVTVFVFLVALGVIVDDSIHILFWRASGDAVSGSSIELSVLLSTLMLCLGLLLCQLSDFPTTRLFAAYCALALLGAVISNLTVLPLLLRQPLSKVTTKPGE